jgi:hypothetical protein
MRNTALKTILLEEEIAMEKILLKELEEAGKLSPETRLVFESNIKSLEYIVEHENGLAI